jgi:hypothetical protein
VNQHVALAIKKILGLHSETIWFEYKPSYRQSLLGTYVLFLSTSTRILRICSVGFKCLLLSVNQFSIHDFSSISFAFYILYNFWDSLISFLTPNVQFWRYLTTLLHVYVTYHSWTLICNMLGYWRHRSICYTSLFTTPLVVTTISVYNVLGPSDVVFRSGPGSSLDLLLGSSLICVSGRSFEPSSVSLQCLSSVSLSRSLFYLCPFSVSVAPQIECLRLG